jgi:hydrogenase maturation protease
VIEVTIGTRSADGDSRPLVIGYGNPLRADDAVGWLVAEALLGDRRADGFDVLAVHELNPEYAVRMAEACRVVLVNTDPGGNPPLPPGHWKVRRADAGQQSRDSDLSGAGWGRRCTPLGLVALAVGLYRAVIPVHLIEVGVGSVEPGEHPSDPVLQAVPRLVELVIGLAAGDEPTAGTGQQPPGAWAR